MLLLFLWMLLTSCAHRSVGNLFESEDKTYEPIETTTVERDSYDTSESANNTTVQITVPSHSSICIYLVCFMCRNRIDLCRKPFNNPCLAENPPDAQF